MNFAGWVLLSLYLSLYECQLPNWLDFSTGSLVYIFYLYITVSLYLLYIFCIFCLYIYICMSYVSTDSALAIVDQKRHLQVCNLNFFSPPGLDSPPLPTFNLLVP